ncbi:FtsB family cell division protein [Tenuibacillus multivorans]|uniref:Cell division protein DivIC n=1 Tax=Tenuibacillus multivorans TaxID=237069 RepID=A0A1G9VYK7_9BACI|nr:septum formation initiator family protein [Tenuibacillus multivorans]GEL78249.1 cell division protein DivIC [Tenuibacillus multivorans]SDM77344.1 cell division protein DivIC [Tenuibacillus multivorans]
MTRPVRKHRNVTKIESTYVQEKEQQIAHKTREKKRLIRRLTAFGVLFVVLTGSLLFTHFNQRAQMSEIQDEHDQKLAELEKHQQENSNLKREVELLSDIDYLLQIARKDYFFSKDGEIIFKLPDEDPSY